MIEAAINYKSITNTNSKVGDFFKKIKNKVNTLISPKKEQTITENFIQEIQKKICTIDGFQQESQKEINKIIGYLENFQNLIDNYTNQNFNELNFKEIEEAQKFQIENIEENFNKLKKGIEQEITKFENNKIYKGKSIISEEKYKKIMEKFRCITDNTTYISNIISLIKKSNIEKFIKTKEDLFQTLITSKQPQEVIYKKKDGITSRNATLKNTEYYNNKILANYEITTEKGRKFKFASSFKDKEDFLKHTQIKEPSQEPTLTKNLEERITNMSYKDQVKNIEKEFETLNTIIKEVNNYFSHGNFK